MADTYVYIQGEYGPVKVKAVDQGDGTYAVLTSGGGGGAVTIADGADVTLGATADAAASSDTGTFSLIALTKRLLQRFVVDSTDRIRVSLYGKATNPGDTAVRVRTPADGDTIIDGLVVNALGRAYNGATLDLVRNNVEAVALASAARTATVNTADLINHNARGVMIMLDVSAASGTGGLTIRIQGKTAAGTYVSLHAAPTAVTTVTQQLYTLYPGTSSTGGAMAQTVSQILPRTWRIQVVHGDGSSYTYSVSYSLIN